MKRKLIALALLFAGITSCSNDEEVIKKNTDYAEPGTAVIVSKFYSVNDALTKADPIRTAAYPEEKEIKSIAFFIQIEGNTDLQRFESEKIVGSPDGLLEGLTSTEIGKYTAKFKMLMTGDHNVYMFALGNYKENGIDLSTITSVDLLNAAATNTITDQKNPERPLLMLGKTTVPLLKEGEAKDVSFKMDRLVARVDVINEAFNAADATKGFRFTSAQVLNGKSKTMILSDNYVGMDAITLIDEMAKKTDVKLLDIDGKEVAENLALVQRLDTLYLHENRNGSQTAGATAATGATAIQINGTFNGTAVSQRVEFMKEDQKTGVKSRLAIARNNLYTIRIRPSQDSTTLSFDITVKDWTNAAGDTLLIDLKKEKPIISTLTSTGLAGATITGKRIDINTPASLAGTIKFTASGTRDNKMVLGHVGRKGAAWINDAVTQGDLTGYTKAVEGDLKREYTIDLTKAKAELSANSTVPSDALIIIQNANDVTFSDTIRICLRPNYATTAIKPVLFKGQFWAPLNVGATTTAYAPTVAGSGYHYQWNRNTPFDPAATVTFVKSPVSYDDVMTGIHKNTFIGINGFSDENFGWMLQSDSHYAASGRGWHENPNPCPAGWRIPTLKEYTLINDLQPKLNTTDKRISIVGDEGVMLYFPAAGIRSYSDGTYIVNGVAQGAAGAYCIDDAVSPTKNVSTFYFPSKATPVKNSDLNIASACEGHSVRCIQE